MEEPGGGRREVKSWGFNRHLPRPRSGPPQSGPGICASCQAVAAGNWATSPRGYHRAWPGSWHLRPWGTYTPPPEWTGCPVAGDRAQLEGPPSSQPIQAGLDPHFLEPLPLGAFPDPPTSAICPEGRRTDLHPGALSSKKESLWFGFQALSAQLAALSCSLYL